MSFSQMILPEFEQEMASTRRVLEQVPDDKLDWKAHPKSNTIGWNANHLVEIPGWVAGTLANLSWDIEGYETPNLRSRAEILAAFDKNVAEACAALNSTTDAAVSQMWSLKSGDNVLMTMPRSVVIRSFVINHTIHHRAHLCVYLRLNDLPVPGMYGPSGDEPAS
ncbi:DinB family protein [Aureliella helgolandensis]|uniref:DinB superfamily protein n=1 Tax=Aureliella helgolandensis TaxID=2527968 RepID=A0A518G961_9BACT|nr:DinB family protein [Aureliella helgolandensis]QDV25134.1 DinB superfamily protein [Aureliella helgolandensis]